MGNGKSIGLENIRGAEAADARMLDYRTVKRAYAILTPVYDILFNKIFHSGRVAAIPPRKSMRLIMRRLRISKPRMSAMVKPL